MGTLRLLQEAKGLGTFYVGTSPLGALIPLVFTAPTPGLYLF